MPDAHIRSATPADLDIVTDFSWNLAFETEDLELDRNTLREGVRTLLDQPDKGRYWIAEVDKTPVGQTSVTTEWSDWRNGYWWWIQSVYIAKDARRNGIFRLLYSAIESAARSTPSVVGLRLYVDRTNAIAKQTYTSLGMTPSHYEFFEAPFR